MINNNTAPQVIDSKNYYYFINWICMSLFNIKMQQTKS